jgi:hypothetical protein
MEEKRPLELNLPPLEDANAVMLWLMDVLRGLAEGRTSEKTAGIMLYGLQLAMVNARFTTFRETNHAEMVRKAPGNRRNRRNRASSPASEGRALPLRARRNAEEEASEDFTAKDAEVAKREEQRELATVTPASEGRTLPLRAQRNAEEEASEDFTAKDAEVAKREEQRELATVTPASEGRTLPLRARRNAEEEASEDFTAKDAEVAKEEKPEAGTALRVENSLEPQNAEGIPGVESAKPLFFGVEAGEGVADNRPVSPPVEPPRKGSQSEVLAVPKDVEHHLRR